MRYVRALAVIFVLTALPAVCGEEVAGESQPADLASQGIADLTLLRDKVLKRYALMVTGESQRLVAPQVSKRAVKTSRIYRLRAGQTARKIRYSAVGQVVSAEQSSRGHEYQSWAELYRCGSTTKGRNGGASIHGYNTRAKSETLDKFAEKLGVDWARFDPFDDLVVHAMFLRNPSDQLGWIERVYLQESELVSAEKIVQGNIRSVWRWKRNRFDFEIELVQSKAHGYVPTQVSYSCKSPGQEAWFARTEIKWRKHAKSQEFLPHVLKASLGSPYGHTEEHHRWVFDWKIGEEVPSEFFDSDSDDFRLKFSPLFDFEFDIAVDRKGMILGTPWKTPGEIAIDQQGKVLKRNGRK